MNFMKMNWIEHTDRWSAGLLLFPRRSFIDIFISNSVLKVEVNAPPAASHQFLQSCSTAN